MGCVLDSSAVLAVLRGEPGEALVESILDEAVLCSVNSVEVVARLMRDGGSAKDAFKALSRLGMKLVPFDNTLVTRAGDLVGRSRRFGLSLSDCACLALAEARNEEAWTADRQWLEAGLPIKIRLIR